MALQDCTFAKLTVQVLQWTIVLPFELVVATFTCQYWNRDISIAVWVSVFWAVIIFVNIFGTLGYAEEEFWSSTFKLIAIIIFMIVAIVLICGGGPSGGAYDEYWGARLWYDPGAFQNGFRGFCSVFVTAAFSYAGTELVGLTAAEAENPLKGTWCLARSSQKLLCSFPLLAPVKVGLQY